MIINSFDIDISDMPTAVVTRTFSVTGNTGAKFRIIALQNPSSSSTHTLYYDFKDKSFAAGHNDLNNNLISTLTSNTYHNSITFPSGGGEFVIKLMPIDGTTIQGSASNIITKSISKAGADATVPFTPTSASTSNYITQPTTTSSGAVNSSASFEFNWDVTNASTDDEGFGLRLTDANYTKINDSYWYFTTTDTVDGAISSATSVVIDDLTDIAVGSIITGVSAGSLSGTPRITAIDTAKKTLTLDSAQTFSDGITLTFKAYGSSNIKKAIGLDVSFDLYPIVTPTTLTKTVRADVTSTTITLNGTYGVAGGGFASISGFGVDNSTANKVRTIEASSSAGSILVNVSQILPQGTVITFNGCHQVINFKGGINIRKYPTSNKTIYLDLDKLITVGVSGF